MSYRRSVVLIVTLGMLAGLHSAARAGDGLDVQAWLSRPGVKLLAVEFYASWCAPCKKAVPLWRELHEKYRDRGLRLVVVSVQDPDGACVNPGWNPDDLVCDTDGEIAEAFGVDDRLPAAFLWSWRGTLLVRKGHVDEVERQVQEELARLPRVSLDQGMGRKIKGLLHSALVRTGKVDVLAGREEDKALAAIRKRSHELQFSDRTACKLGERLAPNSLLKAFLVKDGSGERLLVQLFSAESGCLNASAVVFWNNRKPELGVEEAVAKLVGALRTGAALPGGEAFESESLENAEGDVGSQRQNSHWSFVMELGGKLPFYSVGLEWSPLRWLDAGLGTGTWPVVPSVSQWASTLGAYASFVPFNWGRHSIMVYLAAGGGVIWGTDMRLFALGAGTYYQYRFDAGWSLRVGFTPLFPIGDSFFGIEHFVPMGGVAACIPL